MDGWQDLERTLADKLMGWHLERGPVLCEWAYLGRQGSEVYLYVLCRASTPVREGDSHLPGVSIPAVVVYDEQGSIGEVTIPGAGTLYAEDIRAMFPPRVQEMIFERQIDFRALSDHLALRREHPELPPLYVLGD